VRAFVAVETGTSPATTAPEHLTLRFLGDTDPADLDRIAAALAAAFRDRPAFEFTLAGIGAFPSPRRPRVVWIGVTDGADELRALAARLADALASVGVPPEPEPFVPHVTLFRVRSPRDLDRARALLDGHAPAPPARTVRVSTVVLKESVLGRDGPHHRTVRAFPLADSAGRRSGAASGTDRSFGGGPEVRPPRPPAPPGGPEPSSDDGRRRDHDRAASIRERFPRGGRSGAAPAARWL
jgi:RNA 2',3'-cyclic 3'-phosphodiesterase